MGNRMLGYEVMRALRDNGGSMTMAELLRRWPDAHTLSKVYRALCQLSLTGYRRGGMTRPTADGYELTDAGVRELAGLEADLA